MGPYFGYVEGILPIVAGLLFGHHLDIHGPFRILPSFDGVEKVVLVALPVLSDDLLRLRIGQILYSLLGLQMVLDPCALAVSVDHAVCVAPESMHMSV